LTTEYIDRTTPPKVDTSSAKGPTTQALVALSRSKAPDNTPIDADHDLLNFVMTVSWVGCWTSFLPQKYCPDVGKLDGLI
jgi:hypothetical protein